jgi:hypothetical protein
METWYTSNRTVPSQDCTGFPARLLAYSVVKVLQKSTYNVDFCTLKTEHPSSPGKTFSSPFGWTWATPSLPHLELAK